MVHIIWPNSHDFLVFPKWIYYEDILYVPVIGHQPLSPSNDGLNDNKSTNLWSKTIKNVLENRSVLLMVDFQENDLLKSSRNDFGKISSVRTYKYNLYKTQKAQVEGLEDKKEDDEETEDDVSFENGVVHRATKVQFAELAGSRHDIRTYRFSAYWTYYYF